MDAIDILNVNSKQMILFRVGYDVTYVVKMSACSFRGVFRNVMMECGLCGVWYAISVWLYLRWYEMILNVWSAGCRCKVMSNTHHLRSPVLDWEVPDVAGE